MSAPEIPDHESTVGRGCQPRLRRQPRLPKQASPLSNRPSLCLRNRHPSRASVSRTIGGPRFVVAVDFKDGVGSNRGPEFRSVSRMRKVGNQSRACETSCRRQSVASNAFPLQAVGFACREQAKRLALHSLLNEELCKIAFHSCRGWQSWKLSNLCNRLQCAAS
jgi:hypothetical protein